jgi:hypothetical protein
MDRQVLVDLIRSTRGWAGIDVRSPSDPTASGIRFVIDPASEPLRLAATRSILPDSRVSAG